MNKKPTCNCIEILEAIIQHAKGKACSRYVLALERAIECIEEGTPKKAIERWNSWFEDYDLKKLAKKTQKKQRGKKK